jgi:signal transduction histidine kinase
MGQRLAEAVKALLSDRFEAVWRDDDARRNLAQDLYGRLHMHLELRDASGTLLDQVGDDCHGPSYAVVVGPEPAPLGEVIGCVPAGHPPLTGFIALGLVGFIFWGGTWMLARRVTRPLADLSRVTDEIGSGKLTSRVRLGTERMDEIGDLARSVNHMAKRIERQMQDQRELLAGVSHELRTPLGHVRVLVELMRERGTRPDDLDQVEQEMLELDDLVERLLVNSRLDFGALRRRKLSSHALFERALARAGLPADRIAEASRDLELYGDATLLQRALANLIRNAEAHGQGLVSVRSETAPDGIRFVVEDRGPGFASASPVAILGAFSPGQRPRRADDEPSLEANLGLGLSLVQRIAEAHGGRAFAENAAPRGARIGFTVAKASEDR